MSYHVRNCDERSRQHPSASPVGKRSVGPAWWAIEIGTTDEQAVIREECEETGYTVDVERLSEIYSTPNTPALPIQTETRFHT